MRRRPGHSGMPTPWPWLAATSLLILVACSKTEMFYRNVDWMLERYAAKSVDVNETQLARWRPEMEAILQRHETQELPLISDYFGLLLLALDGSQGAAVDGRCLLSAATLVYTRQAILAADLAAPLLAMLEASQIQHLSGYLAQRRDRYRERYLQGELEQQVEARTDRLVERIEGWTGTLNRAQQQRVERLSGDLPDIAGHWLNYREQQETVLLSLLAEGADEQRLRAHLLGWWMPWTRGGSEFTQTWQLAESEFIAFLDDFAISLEQQQRAHFRDRLLQLRADLEAINGGQPRAVRETPGVFSCEPLSI